MPIYIALFQLDNFDKVQNFVKVPKIVCEAFGVPIYSNSIVAGGFVVMS